MRKSLTLLATGIVTALTLTACGGSSAPSAETQTLDPAKPATLSVGASPVPQAKILEFINQDLAPKAGLKLDIKEIEDYQTPNTALSDGSLDTNYYQHQPWFDDQVKTKGYEFGHGEGVHIEPYAAFSEKVKDISEIKDGAKIAITNDPSNQVRALRVLEKAGLVKDIKDDTSVIAPDRCAEPQEAQVLREPAGTADQRPEGSLRGPGADQRQLHPQGRASAPRMRWPWSPPRTTRTPTSWPGARSPRTTPASRSWTNSSTPPRSRPSSRRNGPTVT